MAYKSKGGCTPITAKIQKTTKGGIVQPLLNMGAPVKMKASSPAKQGGLYNKRKRKVKKQDAAEFSKKRDSDIQRLTSEINAMQRAISNYESKSGGKAPKSDYNYLNKSKAKLKDRKASAAGEAAMLADSKARKNKTNQYDPKNKKSSGESMTPYSVEGGKGVIHGPKVSYDMAYKDRGAAYKDMSKAEYIKEAKRQTKSFTSTGKWDAKRKKQKVASTISSKPVKTVSIETKKPPASIDVSAIKPKASKITNAKAAKRSARKTAKAQKVRQKGIEALESGNLTKARRLKRREERIKKRAVKQAEKAIEPKKPKRAAKGSRAATLRK